MSSSDSTDIDRPTGAGIPGLPDDWPQQATAKIVDTIDMVRVKTSGPAVNVSRTIVYGLIIGLLAPIALILLVMAGVRAADEFLPGQVGPIYLVIGAVFSAIGLFCWFKRPSDAAR